MASTYLQHLYSLFIYADYNKVGTFNMDFIRNSRKSTLAAGLNSLQTWQEMLFSQSTVIEVNQWRLPNGYCCQLIVLSVFDHFVGLAFKGSSH